MLKKVFQGIFLSFCFLAVAGFFLWGMQWFSGAIDGFYRASVSGPVLLEEKPDFPVRAEGSADLNLGVDSALSVFNDFSGQKKILFSKNADSKAYIASLTKLVTAEIILENFDLSAKIEISSKAEEQDARRLLKAGEIFIAKDLLKAMLVESDNAAAYAFAEAMGYDSFIKAMNLKANEVGMEGTYFSSPTGTGSTNYSTAGDMVLLGEYLFKKNSPVLQISSVADFDLLDFDGNFHHRAQSLNELIKDDALGPRIILGKTGETKDAGQCLLLILRPQGGKGYLINVVLGAEDRFLEMKKIINWADASFIWQEAGEFNVSNLKWEQVLTKIPWQTRDSHTVLVYKNKLWLMGGLDGTGFVTEPGLVQYEKSPHFSDVWSSEDGINWVLVSEKSPWGKRRSVSVVDFKGKMWLMGGWGPEVGSQNDVWSSEDGANWKKETEHAAWPAREGQQVIVFQDKIWLMGGVRYDTRELLSDVWYSEDGVNWIEATKNAGWTPRWDGAVAVFNNKLWMAGGMEFGEKILNDVWYTENGSQWLLAANKVWPERQGHALLNYKNRLWAVGRLNVAAVGGVNDVWYSEDGFSWQKTASDPEWTGREDVGVVIFKDKIWILGGMDKNWQWKNDIWYSK